MSSIPIQPIAITGAGGWLGTELLEHLLAVWGPENVKANVICFGSSRRQISLSDGTKLQIEDFADAQSVLGGVELGGLVHLAFLTRDKVADRPLDSYVFENLKLTSKALQVIEVSKPRWVATVSSGAALKAPEFEQIDLDIVANPYGFLKHGEEVLLADACTRVGANLSIGRLWGAGGLFMPRNLAYALSDFIQKAKAGQVIEVKAPHSVFRRYCDAGQFMQLLLLVAQDRQRCTFDSGGHLVEMGALAANIAGATGASVHRAAYDESLPANFYYAKSGQYEELCESYGLAPLALAEIIDRTLTGH